MKTSTLAVIGLIIGLFIFYKGYVSRSANQLPDINQRPEVHLDKRSGSVALSEKWSTPVVFVDLDESLKFRIQPDLDMEIMDAEHLEKAPTPIPAGTIPKIAEHIYKPIWRLCAPAAEEVILDYSIH